jgi:predicted deacylase
MGVIRYNSHGGYIASVVNENELGSVRNTVAGIYRRKKVPGDEVKRGDILAEIIDPYEGEVLSQILSPTDGIIFFAHKSPLVNGDEIVYKIIRRLHE